MDWGLKAQLPFYLEICGRNLPRYLAVVCYSYNITKENLFSSHTL